jgi:hypothetical protein
VKLRRLADIQRQEKQSLQSISDSLDRQLAQSAKQREAETASVHEQIDAVRDSIRILQKSVRSKTDKVQKAEEDAQTKPPKRVISAVREDVDLNQRIAELQKRVDRETFERALSEEELEHVKGEIKRAEAMIDRFKASLTKNQQIAADAVNMRLKVFIEQQREDYRRAIANQRKRNMELEKQKTELIEEEKMLNGFLVSVEKQLQIQMSRLPSLAELQHRMDGGAAQRRSPPAKALRAPDDAEMRTIKKAIVQLKTRKGTSKSVLVGSRYH